MKNTAMLGAILIAISITHTGAFLLGRVSAPVPEVQAADTSACDLKTGTTVDQRNGVWTALNTVSSRGDLSTLTDSDSKKVGLTIAMLLDPQAPLKVRQNGLTGYLQKSGYNFTKEEMADIFKKLETGTPQQRADALTKLVGADAKYANLVKAVLADTTRLNLFLSGKKVPLEQ